MRRDRVIVLLVVIILLGLALRFYKLGDIPFGMDHDEGHNTLDAFQIIQGWRPVFLPRNNGREPLFMYLMAGTMSLFGATLWAVRLTGALASLLMLPAQFLLVSNLPIPRPRVTALISTALVALTFWTISKGHQALRAGLLPAWITLMLWAWWQTLKTTDDSSHNIPFIRNALVWASLTGVFIAAAVYTHLTGRLLPLLIISSALWVAWRGRTWRPLIYASVTLGVALLLTLPQILYFTQNPDMLGYRANQASIFNPEQNQGDLVGALVTNAWNLLLMFNIRGTLSWSENLRGRPVFDPLIGLAFLLGLALLVRDLLGKRGRTPQNAAFLLGITFALMLVPSWLSESAPHYGRLTGIWPVMFFLPAWGLDTVGHWLNTRRQPWGTVAVTATIIICGVWSAYDFFVRYPPAQRAAETFRAVNVERGQTVAALVREGPTYVSPNTWGQSVTQFYNYYNPPSSFNPRYGLVLPPSGDARYAFEPGEYQAADEFEKRWPQAQRVNVQDETGEYVLLYFRFPRAAWPALAGPTDGDHTIFGDNIELVAHAVQPASVSRGKTVAVTLEWLALQPTELDHNFFIHLETPEGRSVGQFDGAPLGGSYGTNRWAPGERIQQRVEIPVAKDAPPGNVVVRLGWYDWRDGARLPIANDDDAAIEIGHIELKQ